MKLNEIANSKDPEIERIKSVLRELRIVSKSKINADMSVDVNGKVSIPGLWTSIQIRFNRISDNFYCAYSRVRSLKGAPQYVGGNFNCDDTDITSLEGAPHRVNGNLFCGNTEITSLNGAPQYVGRGFYCDNTKITSLEGAPQYVGGDFICNNTPKMPSLHGVEKWIPNIKVGKAICVDQTHLLGLALIEGISTVGVWSNYNGTEDMRYFDISHHDPFQFQEQLLEYGLTEQAQL